MRKLVVGYNDLETTYPDLAKDWDYSRNPDKPSDYTYKSMHEAHWRCRICGYEWPKQIRDRVKEKYHLCPKCTAIKRGEERHKKELEKRGSITDPLLLKEWDYEKNEKGPEEYTPKSNDDVFWICSKCDYHYRAKISNRMRVPGKGCACCAGKVVVPGVNDLATKFPQLAAEWHPTKNGDLRPTDVSFGQAKKVWWLCPEGHEYPATINHRTSGSGTNCPKCNSGRQTSFAEQAVYFYVNKVYPDAINRYSDIFSNGMELDIYIPSIKLAIEYDGVAWHKEDKREREIRKYQICQKNGIRLLRLMEKPPENGVLLTADDSLSIEDGPMHEPAQLEKVIRYLLDKIDPVSNPWTRQKFILHSPVDINLERDEIEIRQYMTVLKSGSLVDKYPELAKEWHPTKNGLTTPNKVLPNSDKKYYWHCPVCGKDYKSSPSHRVSGTGCPECGKTKSAIKRGKSVIMIDPDTHEELRTFKTISEAARALGINSSNISTVCKGQRSRAGGFVWRYAESTVT